MRKLAVVRISKDNVHSVILHRSEDGVYVYHRQATEDGPCHADDWFEDVASAETFCYETYHVEAEDWRSIADPLPGCQHDWMEPVRIKGSALGRPEFGSFERLQSDGTWQEVED